MTSFSWSQAPHPIVALAPMAGVTDASYRQLIKRIAPEVIVYTEFLSTDAISYGAKRTLDMISFDTEIERPFIVQVFGHDPDHFLKAAKIIEELGADGIDINMGCPAAKVVSSCHGSALLKDPKLAAELVHATVKAVNIPVTVKIRIGVRENEYLAPALAKLAQGCGVSGVIVHARPVSKRHSGRPDWEGLRQTVAAVSIPVIGNGGVNVPNDAEDFLKISGCAGVSVGRAAIGDPGIFKRIRHYLSTGERLPEATHQDKLETLAQHVAWAAEFFGERTGLLRLRKIVPYYVAGFPMATSFRAQANRIATLMEWTVLLDKTREALHV